MTPQECSVIHVEVRALALEVTGQVYGGSKLEEVKVNVASYRVVNRDFMGETWAGKCQYSTRCLMMNMLLCTSPDRYRGVLAHEYAHAVAFALFGREGAKHGPKWKQVMVRMDRAPEQFHRFNTAAVGKPVVAAPAMSFLWCKACTEVVKVPHFALRPGVAAKCPKCGGYAK